MRKLLLGVGLLLAGRYVARHTPVGWRRFTSLQALVGAIMANAASEMLAKNKARTAPSVPPAQSI